MSKQNTRATIDANIKQNGQQLITGQILNSVLNTMVTDYAEQAETTEKLTDLMRKTDDLKGSIFGKYGVEEIASLNTGKSDTLAYYMSHKPSNGIVTSVTYKAKQGITRFSRIKTAQLGGSFISATVIAEFTNTAEEDGNIVTRPLSVVLANDEYLGIRDNYYFGAYAGETIYSNNITSSNYALAYIIEGESVKGDIKALVSEVSSISGKIDSSIGIVSQIASGNINASGVVKQDTPSRVLYVAPCKYSRIKVSNGDLYGFYSSLPVVNSVAVDSARHIQTLDNTIITIPDGVKYIAVRADREPIFSAEDDGIIQRLKVVEERTNGNDVRFVASDVAMFETIGFCGDSYMAGMIVTSENPTITAENRNLCWGKIVERTHGISASIYALGGASVVNNKPTNPYYLDNSSCLPLLLSESAKKLYVISLGHNDCYISTYTTKTKAEFLNEFKTNYTTIITSILSHAPNAKIILCQQSGPYARKGWGADINAMIATIGQERGLPVLNPNNDVYLSSAVYEETMVHDHPTFSGYAGIAKAFDRQFSFATTQYFEYFKGYTGL